LSDIKELRWIRIFDPSLIPRYLIEQIKKRDFTYEKFIEYYKDSCLITTENGLMFNPSCHFYVLADAKNIIKGFVLYGADALEDTLFIHKYSVDKEYWEKGYAMGRLVEHAKDLMKELNVKQILLVTRYPKHSEKHGMKRSKDILMEYIGEDNGK